MPDASATPHVYVIALGSNKPLARGLGPADLVDAAFEALDNPPLMLIAKSSSFQSLPLGPSRRRYVNAVALIETDLSPPAVLNHLQDIENRYGRSRQRRWGSRTLDLDIILWSGGIWSGCDLAIPHVAFRDRAFVLQPLAKIAPDWRDPVQRLTVSHLTVRHLRRKPVDHRTNAI